MLRAISKKITVWSITVMDINNFVITGEKSKIRCIMIDKTIKGVYWL